MSSSHARLRGEWAPISTALFRDREFRRVSKDARLLHLAAHLYANHAMTDGEIEPADLPLVLAEADVAPGAVRELVEAGLWEERGAVHVLRDFRGLPREERLRRRDADRARQQRHRHPGAVRDGVTRDTTRDDARDVRCDDTGNVTPPSPRTPHPPRMRGTEGSENPEGREKSQLKPVDSLPARGEGLAADADPRAALGDRLVVELAPLVAGGVLSPIDQGRVRTWPYAFQHLGQGGPGAFVEPCRRLAAEATGRGNPPKTVRYFEGRLSDLDAAIVDNRTVPPGRSHLDGLTSVAQVLGPGLSASAAPGARRSGRQTESNSSPAAPGRPAEESNR